MMCDSLLTESGDLSSLSLGDTSGLEQFPLNEDSSSDTTVIPTSNTATLVARLRYFVSTLNYYDVCFLPNC